MQTPSTSTSSGAFSNTSHSNNILFTQLGPGSSPLLIMSHSELSDPLVLLPSELILHVLNFTPASTLASLTRASKAWHHFIDMEHQDAIYSSPSKTDRPDGGMVTDFAFLSPTTSFAKYLDGVASWKDLCKRQTLLSRNWAASEPETRESLVQVGRNRVWRFKPDFKRRFFLSTSHDGGFRVTDMDTGRIIWELPNAQVRPFAHLEYQDGTAVWDRYGNALEVGLNPMLFPRGVYHPTANCRHAYIHWDNR